MSDVVIRVENLSKQYRIGAAQKKHRRAAAALSQAMLAPVRAVASMFDGQRRSESHGENTIWALKDVYFEVKRGEIVGLVGRNGSGKSTLFKILSRITAPTAGFAEIRGRVGSLLEVGTGFHPQLTGRENIYLNGVIMGMKRAEIEKKFDEIVDFSEVEKFIDTPVKHYSSGMYMRLAFGVAAHLEPEILLVDEVLAVGDAAFQKKCLGKIEDVAKEGRTVLFVSHNLHAVSTLTTRALLLNTGRLIFDGDTFSALGHYRATWNKITAGEYYEPNKSTGIIRARVITSEANQIHRFGKRLIFEFEVAFERKPKNGFISFQVIDEELKPIMHLWFSDSDQQWSRAGRVLLRCEIPNPRVYMGRYTLTTHLSDAATKEHFDTVEGICSFEVVMDGVPREYKWTQGACAYLEDAKWVPIGNSLSEKREERVSLSTSLPSNLKSL
jgi:homopolymeric O-antigen transport system ATP-binding protein